MATIVVASVSGHKTSTHRSDWPVEAGPVHLGLSHYLVSQGIKDFFIIARGMLAGAPAVGSAVATITAVSPQSGGLAEAKVEGPLAHALIALGIDALVLQGRAPQISGLVVKPSADGVVLEWAESLAMKDATVWETDDAVRVSESDVILAIGQPGMNQHPGASIVTNRGFPSAQGGLGAVMGALNVKYIAIRAGAFTRTQTETEGRLTREYEQRIDSNPLTKSERDLPGFALWPSPDLHGYAGPGDFPATPSPGLAKFSALDYLPWVVDDGQEACPGCPQACLKAFSVGSTDPVDGGRAHQLGMASFAMRKDAPDERTVISFNSLCHKLGVEHLVAEQALRGEEALSPDTLEQALVAAFAPSAAPINSAINLKGMVVPPFDPRGNQGLGVGYALNPTGPRYDVLEHDIDFDTAFLPPERVDRGTGFGLPGGGLPMGTLDSRRHDSLEQLWLAWSGFDALGVCEYAAPPTRELTIEGICVLVSDHSGTPFSREDLLRLGKVRLGLLRSANAILGVPAVEDTLPDHFFETPIEGGMLDGVVVDRDDFQRAAEYLMESFEWKSPGLKKVGQVSTAVEAAHVLAARLMEGAQ